MQRQEKIERIQRLLDSQSTLTLATTDAAGRPRSTPLFYIADEALRLHWFSSPRSQHSLNCARCGQVSLAVFAPTADWRRICGLQASGAVAVVADRAERQAITARYAERFHLGKLFATALARHRLYRFQPEWIRLTDNAVRFGFRFEIDLVK